MYKQRAPRGASLIEVMVAMLLVAVALLALASANTLASQSTRRSYRHYMAMRLAQQRLDGLMVGEQKQKLPLAAAGGSFVPDGTPADCQEAWGNRLAELCNGSDPSLLGWVDLYGRPCRRTGTPEQGYHPACQYRRYVRFERTSSPGGQADVWRIFVAVSHARDGQCGNFNRGDYECAVTSAMLTR